MKLAVIADRLIMGGLETHIISLTNELLRRGHQVLLNAAYVNPEILNSIQAEPESFHFREWTEDVLDDLSWFQPEVIHAHPFTGIYRGYYAAFSLRKPLIITMHGLYDYGLDRSTLGNQISSYASSIIAVDQRVADLLQHATGHPEKVRVIYNGIDRKIFSTAISCQVEAYLKYNLNPDYVTIVSVSRLADGKEQPVYQMIRSAPKLARRLNGLNLVIVGDGAWYDQIKLQAELAAGSESLLHLAVVGGTLAVEKFLAMADVVLACDRAALEAMSCQKPVLAVSAGGFAEPITEANFFEIIIKRSGYQVLTDEALNEKLCFLLSNLEYRGQIAKSGAKIVQDNFDVAVMARQTEELYQLALRRQK